jgi:hypothetical protein
MEFFEKLPSRRTGVEALRFVQASVSFAEARTRMRVRDECPKGLNGNSGWR